MNEGLSLLPFAVFFLYSIYYIFISLVIRIIFIFIKQTNYHLKNIISVFLAAIIYSLYVYITKLSFEKVEIVFNPIYKISIIISLIILLFFFEWINFLIESDKTARMKNKRT